MKIKALVFFLSIISIGLAQNDLVKIKKKDRKNKIKETYYAQALDPDIKDGLYKYQHAKSQIITGQYKNNLKTGKWVYQINSDFKIIGHYQNGEKQGVWFYIQNNDTISILTYFNDQYSGTQIGKHSNGEIASMTNYILGIENGKAETWFKNGKTDEIINYENGDFHGERQIFSKDGDLIYKLDYYKNTPINLQILGQKTTQLAFTGDLKNGEGNITSFIIDNKINQKQTLISRNYKDSLLDGSIIRFNSLGDTSLIGQYKKGFMVGEWHFFNIKGERTNSKFYNYSDSLKVDSTISKTQNFNSPINIIESKPIFYGGDTKLMNFISKNVKYPEWCLDEGIQGRVFVNFSIDKLGKVTDIEVYKPVHPLLDEEAIRVIKLFPYWKPGIQAGKPVKVKYQVPINFRIFNNYKRHQ